MSESNDEIRLREELAERWVKAQPTVSAFVFSMVHRYDAAEDIVQQVAMEAARRFEDYDRSKPFIAWLLRIARSRIVDYCRRVGRDPHQFSSELVDELAEAYGYINDHDQWQLDALNECVGELTPKSQKMLKMCYGQSMKPREIAEATGTAPTVVRTTLSRIRKTLRECIEQKAAGGDA